MSFEFIVVGKPVEEPPVEMIAPKLSLSIGRMRQKNLDIAEVYKSSNAVFSYSTPLINFSHSIHIRRKVKIVAFVDLRKPEIKRRFFRVLIGLDVIADYTVFNKSRLLVFITK